MQRKNLGHNWHTHARTHTQLPQLCQRSGELRAGGVKPLAQLVGGGGGGRPDMAQAGGRNPEGIEAVLTHGWEIAEALFAPDSA